MSGAKKFYSHDARGVLCVRAEQYDALAAELQRTSDYLHHEEARCRLMLVEVEELRDELAKLKSVTANQFVRSYAGQNDQRAIDDLVAAGIRADVERIAGLEAELATLKAGAGEPVEVVAWLLAHEKGGRAVDLNSQSMQVMQQTVGGVVSGLMTVAQHNRIIALDDQPQPAQDISGLVSALELAANRLGRTAIYVDFEMRSEIDEWEQEAREALAKFAQGGGDHDA